MDRPRVGVVKVEHVGADAVDERRMQDIHALAAPEHRRLGRTAKRLNCRQRAFHGFMAAAADGATEPVQDGAARFVAHALRDIRPARIDEVTGQSFGNFHLLKV
jgi:hypothetical protein